MATISKTRIRSLTAYKKGFKDGDEISVSTILTPDNKGRAIEVGFSKSCDTGETVLPAGLGNVTRFNADGRYVPQKDQPMETAYRQIEWTWKQFKGPYETEEITEIRDMPYERYPRKFIPPPAIELSLQENSTGDQLITSPKIILSNKTEPQIIHAVNVLLEIFGECELVDNALNSIVSSKTVRLNWRLLPPGNRPWSELRKEVRPIIGRLSKGNKPVIEKRLESVNGYQPEFTAIGLGGFSGYVVFGFPEKNLYVFESSETNNATYVFNKDWQSLSQMTKAEILDNNLHHSRLIHRKSWFDQLNQLLN